MTPEASSFSPVEAWQRSTSAFFWFINDLSIVGILDDAAFLPPIYATFNQGVSLILG
jgi:hypothetical protein